jgi:hypothetical protein
MFFIPRPPRRTYSGLQKRTSSTLKQYIYLLFLSRVTFAHLVPHPIQPTKINLDLCGSHTVQLFSTFVWGGRGEGKGLTGQMLVLS